MGGPLRTTFRIIRGSASTIKNKSVKNNHTVTICLQRYFWHYILTHSFLQTFCHQIKKTIVILKKGSLSHYCVAWMAFRVSIIDNNNIGFKLSNWFRLSVTLIQSNWNLPLMLQLYINVYDVNYNEYTVS